MTTSATKTCPACRAAADGRFCSTCGYPLEGAACAACGGPLVPGASFCHHCAAPVGATMLRARAAAPASPGARVPWMVGGAALLAMIVLVAAQAARSDPSAGGTVASSMGTVEPIVRGPDLSTMSPRERADRLFNRVMSYHERGMSDSVAFFADMGISAYRMLPVLDADAQYDIGRIAEVSGDAALARAQADSILRESPTHLLGLTLGGRAARMTADERAAADFDRRLLAAESAERRKDLPEYQRHAGDIDEALRTARGQSP